MFKKDSFVWKYYMRLFFALIVYCCTLMVAGQAATSDEQKPTAFFKNNP